MVVLCTSIKINGKVLQVNKDMVHTVYEEISIDKPTVCEMNAQKRAKNNRSKVVVLLQGIILLVWLS